MPPSKPEPERTLQLSIPKEAFNRHYERIKDALPPSVRSKPNSKYSTKTILEYLMMMCSEGASHEGISQRWRDKIGRKSVPTGACLLKRIGGSPYLETRDSCDRMLGSTLDDPRTARLLKKPVVTATDEHDVAAMFRDVDEEYMATGKPKGGTSKRLRYTTVKVVGGSIGLTVAIHPTGKRYNKAGIVRQLLERARRAGVRSKLHLLDRGFYSAEVLSTLIKIDQPFIMPAVKNSGTVSAIESHASGARKAVQQYTVRGKGAEATITLVIVPKEGAKDTDPPKDRYLVFATNFSVRKARAMLAGIPKEYRRRWGIETGYRVAKQVRPFTSSRNPSVRLMLFCFTMILYNLWVISGWIAGGCTAGTGSDAYARPPITMYRMMAAMYAACERMIMEDVSSEAFFAEAVT